MAARAPNPLRLSELTLLVLMAKNNVVPEHKQTNKIIARN